MTQPLVSRTADRTPWKPGQWIAAGCGLLLCGVVLGVIANDDSGAAWTLFALVAVPGSLMLTVGVVAKAVQVGIRSARD